MVKNYIYYWTSKELQMKKQSIHPGKILKTTFLDPEKISIKTLAQQLDISTQKLSKIIKGQHSPLLTICH
jgi:plasmid maintenance system antidote protein VapI